MTVPIKRVPPPPPIAQNDPVFNRWLHDLTSFIQEGGGIDVGVIPGYDTLLSTVATHSIELASHTTQIATNTSNILTLFSTTATHTSQIAVNTTNITANATTIASNTTDITNNTAAIATLASRAQVLHGTAAPASGLGVDGDWFADTVAKHIYVKVSGAWVLIV